MLLICEKELDLYAKLYISLKTKIVRVVHSSAVRNER